MKKSSFAFGMLSPFVLLTSMFYLLPTLFALIISFTNMDFKMDWHFIGLDNYIRILSDPNIPAIIGKTVTYVSITLIFNIALGLILAVITVYSMKDNTHGKIIRTLWMLPRMMPSVVIVLLWSSFFSPTENGLLNQIMHLFGFGATSWVVDYAMGIVILINATIGISFGMLILSAAIKSIPKDLYQAAMTDGASDLAIVREIVLSSIRWPLMFCTIIQTLALISSYEYILLMTGGGPVIDTTVWSLYAYKKAFMSSDYGYASALSVVLVAVSLLLTMLLLKFFNFNEMMTDNRGS